MNIIEIIIIAACAAIVIGTAAAAIIRRKKGKVSCSCGDCSACPYSRYEGKENECHKG
ncbi:MAG: hypothetical protein GX304_01355 [Clostridiales bacterium]|jgi:hypothetical protein|nr:hypothetical protein [Clostridiales bacterium]